MTTNTKARLVGTLGALGVSGLALHGINELKKFNKFRRSKGNENKSYRDYRNHRKFMKRVNKMRRELKKNGEIKISKGTYYKSHTNKMDDIVKMGRDVAAASGNNGAYVQRQYPNSKYSIMTGVDKDNNGVGKKYVIRNNRWIHKNMADKDSILMR